MKIKSDVTDDYYDVTYKNGTTFVKHKTGTMDLGGMYGQGAAVREFERRMGIRWGF